MTAPSDAVPEFPRETQVGGRLAPTRPFYWSVRRELWENRSLYLAPLIAAAVVLFGFLLSTTHLPRSMRALWALDPAEQSAELTRPYHIVAFAIVLTSLLVALFYCLGALHSERRDRSILFWKSLPVSDLTTVLSKASIPLVVLPLVTFVVVVATQLFMLLLSTVILLLNGLSAAALWTQLSLFQSALALLYSLAVLALWHAPIYGWLLLVSGWARRATFLWAVLPPLALCVVENMAFGTSNLASLLGRRLTGGFAEAFSSMAHGSGFTSPLQQLDPIKFLINPSLWAGLGIAAALIAASVWLRRYREPI